MLTGCAAIPQCARWSVTERSLYLLPRPVGPKTLTGQRQVKRQPDLRGSKWSGICAGWRPLWTRFMPGIATPPRSSDTRSGCTFGFRSAFAWSKRYWRLAASR